MDVTKKVQQVWRSPWKKFENYFEKKANKKNMQNLIYQGCDRQLHVINLASIYGK